MTKPGVLFLDIDGTINLIPENAGEKPDSEWDDLTLYMVPSGTLMSTPAGPRGPFPMWMSKQMCAEIQGLGVEIRWLTTWADEANMVISPLVGLPEDLVVAGQQSWGTNKPWKFLAIVDHVADEATPFIWADDDAIWGPQREWAAECGVANLLVRTDEHKGITPAQIDEIRTFVKGLP